MIRTIAAANLLRNGAQDPMRLTPQTDIIPGRCRRLGGSNDRCSPSALDRVVSVEFREFQLQAAFCHTERQGARAGLVWSALHHLNSAATGCVTANEPAI